MPFITNDASSTNTVIGNRNRIINGNMRIDQRNVGGVQTIGNGNSAYIIDRFSGSNNLPNTITAQQVILGTANVPPKLPASLLITNNN